MSHFDACQPLPGMEKMKQHISEILNQSLNRKFPNTTASSYGFITFSD
jgi:hypothetical protein